MHKIMIMMFWPATFLTGTLETLFKHEKSIFSGSVTELKSVILINNRNCTVNHLAKKSKISKKEKHTN